MSYFIIKKNKMKQNDKYCIDSVKVNLQAVLYLAQMDTNSKPRWNLSPALFLTYSPIPAIVSPNILINFILIKVCTHFFLQDL